MLEQALDDITTIRDRYDAAAGTYAEKYFDELERKPFDRDMLRRFSELTRGLGTVCDMGCGPGEVAAYLSRCGSDVMGMDISGEMLARAAKLSPHISFKQGNMFDLPLEDHSLGGIAAFYALVNYGADDAGKAVSEFYRVIRPGGLLLIAFHAGDNQILEAENFFDSGSRLNFCLLDTDTVLQKICGAGFSIEEAAVRYPYKEEYPTKRAYILARKPGV